MGKFNFGFLSIGHQEISISIPRPVGRVVTVKLEKVIKCCREPIISVIVDENYPL